MTEDFMTLTLDLWDIPAESARRVGHPAPFPVELPEQLIRLYTYVDDLVLDPFMGSGSALVAAAGLGRRYVGYDTDPHYVDLARRRVAGATVPAPDGGSAAAGEGKAAKTLAEDVLVEAGFAVVGRNRRVPRTGVTVSFEATDADGATWYFDVAGPYTSHRGGLQRTEMVWRTLGRAHALRGRNPGRIPLVLLTTHLPKRNGEGDRALRAAGPAAFFDAVELLSEEGRRRLGRCARGGRTRSPEAGFWTDADLGRGQADPDGIS